MANNTFLDLIDKNAAQFLVGSYKNLPRNTFRGTLHDNPPTRGTQSGIKLPTIEELSFIPLMRQFGAVASRRTDRRVAMWVQTVTHLLGRLDEGDQYEIMKKYSQVKSLLLAPTQVLPGFLYTFRYEAQSEHYDRYPLVLVLKKDTTGFVGLNFHYLPLVWRFALFEGLMPLIAPLPVSQLSRILITYKRLSSGTKYHYWESTIKRYTFSRVRSRMVFIAPMEWAAAIAYPSEHFIHTTPNAVWISSLKQ